MSDGQIYQYRPTKEGNKFRDWEWREEPISVRFYFLLVAPFSDSWASASRKKIMGTVCLDLAKALYPDCSLLTSSFEAAVYRWIWVWIVMLPRQGTSTRSCIDKVPARDVEVHCHLVINSPGFPRFGNSYPHTKLGFGGQYHLRSAICCIWLLL